MLIDPQLVASAIAPLSLKASELAALVDSLTRRPQSAVRIRPGCERSGLPFATSSLPWHGRGFFVPGDARPGGTLAFAAGAVYVQDAASLLAVAMLDPLPGELVCDLCAAPGGKATAILESLGGSGWLVANEAVQSRWSVLQFSLARHGSDRYFVSGFDPDELARRLPGQFDAVLVDAPCSGQSLVGRGKQRVSAFAARTMEHCAARQTRILDAAARLIRPGGRMVYSTCTLAYAENEGQAASFLERHPEFELQPPSLDLALACGADRNGIGVRLWPQRHGCGAAFAASVRRTAATERGPASTSRNLRDLGLRPGALPAGFHEWGELRNVAVYQLGPQCFAWPADAPYELIIQAQSGPEVAFRKVSTWFPAYALAMRRDEHWHPRRQLELDDPPALRYMQGQVLRGDLVGWGVASWKRQPLGWLKGDGQQMKNHLPKAGRISMSAGSR